MTTEEKANQVVSCAKELAASAKSWIEFSNRMFDQDRGVVAKTFKRIPERQAFYETPQYEEVNRIFLEVVKRFGVAHGAASKKSGKFVVRMPRSIHQMLDVEASSEGVSLNQLALSKLSVPLRGPDQTRALVVEAFRRVHDGYSTDNVVIDPKIDKLFLKECRSLGLAENDYRLNHLLLDIRKSSKIVLPPSTKRPMIRDYDQFEFASEIAFRYLQRNEGVTLDRVLCDPELRNRFDEYAKRLAPEQSVFKLRKAALNLRKSHLLKPGDALNTMYEMRSTGPIVQVDLSKLPTDAAAYVFSGNNRPLFAGETENLQARIKRHLLTSGNKGLPEWIEESIAATTLELQFVVLPKLVKDDRLSWLRNFINKEKPLLNYQKA